MDKSDPKIHDDNPPMDAAFMARMKPSQRTTLSQAMAPAQPQDFEWEPARSNMTTHTLNPKSKRAAWIAVTALDAKLTVVSGNVDDFADIGFGAVDPIGGRSDQQAVNKLLTDNRQYYIDDSSTIY
jgi:hypothetical protein